MFVYNNILFEHLQKISPLSCKLQLGIVLVIGCKHKKLLPEQTVLKVTSMILTNINSTWTWREDKKGKRYILSSISHSEARYWACKLCQTYTSKEILVRQKMTKLVCINVLVLISCFIPSHPPKEQLVMILSANFSIC